eukprot:TRINITY_DN8138_c0_g1_i1.p1 TRINITY_DN8138_c0_g1~~TRINITY_DN8138_c0_g1_i1.p1  ORF type:complete len:1051 (+),score=266.47 TRINITY_DN8138_c0_g1_i1:75-3155(+)
MAAGAEPPQPPWDIVAISAHRRSDAALFCAQLDRRRADCPRWAARLGLAQATAVLAVPDPFEDDPSRDAAVGSGGAALNAVLAAAEHISAERGSGTLLMDVFGGKRVAVILSGRADGGTTGSHLGKAFAPLPIGSEGCLASGGCTNAELMLLNLCRLADPASALWVCSTEWVVHVPPAYSSPFTGTDGISALALPCPPAEAAAHGVYKVHEADGALLDVLYQPGAAAAAAAGALLADGRVAVVAPVTRFCPRAAEALLSLHARPPIDACTYYGYDSNSRPSRLNLYLDCVMAATAEGRGRYAAQQPAAGAAPSGSPVSTLTRHGREVVLTAFDGVGATACVAREPLFFTYPRDGREWLAALSPLQAAAAGDPVLSPDPRAASPRCRFPGGAGTIVHRSQVGDGVRIGAGSAVLCCRLGDGCTVGADCRLYSVDVPPGGQVPDGSYLGAPAAVGPADDPAPLSPAADEAERAQIAAAEQELRAVRLLGAALDMAAVREALLSENDRNEYLTPCFVRLACGGPEARGTVLDMLDELLLQLPLARLGRALHLAADFLAQAARGAGGLRSGPARNPRWMPALQELQHWDGGQEGKARWVAALAKERRRWLDTPDRLVRASRHYEGAAAVITARCVASASAFIDWTLSSSRPETGLWLEAAAPARIDLAGGWTDTPPVSFEAGGRVINAAILVDGARPLQAFARRLDEPVLRLGTHEGVVLCAELSQLRDYAVPQAPAALLKAAIVSLGVVDMGGAPLAEQLAALGGGVELRTFSSLPVGSGLGGSSILGGVVLRALGLCMGRDYCHDALVHAVLHLEQLLTTGGGWQDQVGGFFGGIKQCTSAPDLPLRVVTEQLSPAPGLLRTLNDHLLLIYTGRARLARNLLQGVLRRWASRLPEVVDTVQGLKSNAADLHRAVIDGDLATIGRCVGTYWSQKKEMAGGGVEPSAVRDALDKWRDRLHGATLAGAGGGGFLFLVTKEPRAMDTFRALAADVSGGQDFQFHECAVDEHGLTERLLGADLPPHSPVLGGL